MRRLIFILSVLMSSTAFANLYQCVNGKTEPVFHEDKLDFSQKKGHLFAEALSEKTHSQNLRPFLIYYVVDSPEAYMQLTVKYEIAKLKIACEQSKNVNFIAFSNRAYVEKNEFVVCKNTEFKTFNFSAFPELNKSLQKKLNFIKTGDHTKTNLGPMNYLVKYSPTVNDAFGRYPLAHPDFLYDLVTLATTHKDLFPSNEYMPFMNLKSHGSTTNVLSGLQDCQEEAKKRSQDEALQDKLSPEEISFLKNDDFSSDITRVETILNRIGLSESIDVSGDSLGYTFMGNRFMGNTHLGNTHLGNTHLGNRFMGNTHLGSAVTGLGAGEGLGAEFSFGLYHVGLTAVFAHLFNEENEKTLGYVMLESCDTNRNIEFHHASISNVLGIYSAQHSLWYRNINWWNILSEANGSTKRMVELLHMSSGDILNIITL